ncbi:PREDICTED: ranBP-type and C3HC4-type zinc finger-containing protein 1-like [Priapulus caudatus]|uniref:RanBP-type and C3HC4-type zinc finger-containing protein 1-like n=1 Tax=Priapulus caudatus TaxID=37621 RepID=A0ABM1E2R1_PRICU|nr:PREDICTED: ranBP-type and C3HC4-type zinc finger-containing protein 1-like [Priapulus caudatus]XP_014666480.1 PREDICTED: ranBP-type and C3HC4-type zinc finger-containing protein 1-like [Priapulus caudatus]XP_014666481.1 PREDICTED: ranBP-type and C3HC4-type zinc finger-containing protein 1-like [Priapulus caudatus]XP_014666482.1 PREDICTED: ranBP-type and C3HC4-type zinc finger-containing protein 1-like [Priapulus caudatus]
MALNIPPAPSPQSVAHADQEHERTIRLTVFVEDRYSTGGRIGIHVVPTITVAELTQKIFREYGLPRHVQRWIIRNRLPGEHETLQQCGVNSPGCAVYLYVVTPQINKNI